LSLRFASFSPSWTRFSASNRRLTAPCRATA
jgi:hypothetical protein